MRQQAEQCERHNQGAELEPSKHSASAMMSNGAKL